MQPFVRMSLEERSNFYNEIDCYGNHAFLKIKCNFATANINFNAKKITFVHQQQKSTPSCNKSKDIIENVTLLLIEELTLC